MEKKRCRWAENGSVMLKEYHDTEWGKPLREDQALFELLILESFHSGLSWQIVLHKRQAFRQAMDHFDPVKLAAYDEKKIESLLENPQLIRHRKKLEAAVANARCYLDIKAEYGTFLAYLNQFVPEERIPLRESPHPARTVWSDALARDMKKRGMKFLGSVTVQAFLEAAGFMDGHEADCFCIFG